MPRSIIARHIRFAPFPLPVVQQCFIRGRKVIIFASPRFPASRASRKPSSNFLFVTRRLTTWLKFCGAARPSSAISDSSVTAASTPSRFATEVSALFCRLQSISSPPFLLFLSCSTLAVACKARTCEMFGDGRHGRRFHRTRRGHLAH